MDQLSFRSRLILISAYALAMAYLEAAVVVYLRNLYYPAGFDLPLKTMPIGMVAVEVARELSTIIMLAVVAGLAGRRFWERFGYFLILFGIWDISYYVWLVVVLGWPASIFDWDILFLVPIPWIAPVIAPMLIALEMVICGFMIVCRYSDGREFRPSNAALGVGIAATVVLLFSFVSDTGATFHQQTPKPYNYFLLILGLLMYLWAFATSVRRKSAEIR
jgi:hypothetical protein